MTQSKPLVLVDGSSYLYRAFHALPPLTNSKGKPTGATKGVINMLRRLQKDFPESPLVVVFDAKGKTFRDDIFAEYKAHRPPMPDDLRVQIESIHQIIRAMGLPLLIIDGVEADDVIGTLAAQGTSAGIEVVISTGDKDMAQLVSEHVSLVNTMTETTMDIPGVVEKFGIEPKYIIDFLALMGDKSDNIPGVAGVGEKTALGLIQNLGSIDEIYQKLEQVAELPIRGAKKLGEKLAASEEQARLSYELATIKLDVELDYTAQQLSKGELASPADNNQLLALFKELEFKTWIKEFSELAESSPQNGDPEKVETEDGSNQGLGNRPGKYETILDEKEFKKWLKKLEKAPHFAFDTETTSLDYAEAKIVGVSFAVEEGIAAYAPFGHDYLDAPEQLSEQQVLGALKPLLENAALKKVGQNLKYDAHVLKNHDIEMRGIADDSMLMSYVLNSTATRHDMDSLAQFYLDYCTTHYEDIAGKGVKQLSFNQIALEQAGSYAAEDADITLRLCNVLRRELAKIPSLKELYEQIELPLLEVILHMESAGAIIDGEMLGEQSQWLEGRMAELVKEAYDIAGEEFNLASPKQLQAILFEKLKIPVLKKTPKGQPSTAEPVLQELALDYPLPRVIMEYRGLAKLKSTYTDKLPLQIHPKTGRVHTSYHQAVTATGRLSSSDPNLQNIPIRTEEGRRVRQAFVPPANCKMLAADYSQIELRIMAHLSQDKGLLDAFNHNLDVHRATAAEVFGVEVEGVSSDQRRKAKAINFGLIYGMSAFGLARQLEIGRNDAQRYIDRYFDRYPGVLRYMNETRSEAAEKGYVETLFGRRLYLPDINASNGMRRQAAERTAINAPMQGTAADIIKRAMLTIDAWLQESQLNVSMIMQVHDELIFEVPENNIKEVAEQVELMMSQSASLSVPLVVDVGVGDNWDEAH